MNFETIRQADSALAKMMQEFEHYQDMGPSYIQRALGFLYALAQDDGFKSKKYRDAMNPERDLPILRLVGLLDDKNELPLQLNDYRLASVGSSSQ